MQYLFDWGDGTNSGWLPAYLNTASKTWATPGTYKVRVQARCATHPSVVSNWSSELLVTIVTHDVTAAGHWLKADVVVGVATQTTGAVGLAGGNAPAGGYTIHLASSDPSIVNVPATVTIPEGYGGTTFAIVGKGVGTTDIIAAVAGFVDTSAVKVVKPTFEYNWVPTAIMVGETLGIGVAPYVPDGSYYYYASGPFKYLNTAQAVDQAVTVSLSSENPAVIQVPSSTTLPAGHNATSDFDIQPVGTGTSVLTASAPGWDSKTSVRITVVQDGDGGGGGDGGGE